MNTEPSEFFEVLPSSVESAGSQRHRSIVLPWCGSPSGAVPGVAPLEHVLAQNKKVAICLDHIAAYPLGFEVNLTILFDNVDPGFGPILGSRRIRNVGRSEISPEMLRFGVQFADGTKATNTRSRLPGLTDRDEPSEPVILERGGRGDGDRWEQSYWLWPLPPPGPLAFVCEWPGVEIPLTRWEIDGKTVRDASGRSQVIFPKEQS
jgi:hypothetical protein